MHDSYRVPVEKLRGEYRSEDFPFETTAEIDSLSEVIFGQERAARAMEFGLKIRQHGYNLFVVGPSGSGKSAYALAKAKEVADQEPVPVDWCYVHHFRQPDHPVAISFPSGKARVFRSDMETVVKEAERVIRAAFAGEEFEKKRREVHARLDEQIEKIWKNIEKYVRDHNFSIERTSQGVVTVPLRFGRPISNEEFKTMPEAAREELNRKGKEIEAEVAEAARRVRLVERQMEEVYARLKVETARQAVHPLLEEYREAYKEHAQVLRFLTEVEEDMAENYRLFEGGEKSEKPSIFSMLADEKEKYNRYKVNVLVDHSRLTSAPVVFETNPSYYNLFGKVEHKGSFGSVVTDFSMIKPGALHQSNGGYLLIQAAELLVNPMSWVMLKRALKTGTLRMENLLEERGLTASSGLKPEEIPLATKVILIGTSYLYQVLSRMDEDFQKIFKVKVEFDSDMDRSPEHIRDFAGFVKSYTEKHHLPPFHREALAELINYSSRVAGDQRRLSTRFQALSRVLDEASFWALEEGGQTVVLRRHVKKALEEREYRIGGIAEKIRDSIADGTIMVDIQGAVVGQINALAVLQTEDYAFGQPHRITANTFLGRRGILHIEREASLSGRFHDKGLLILSGYLAGRFAQNRPLPLSASITFEQSYSMIDGDSASSTELYALLSSLSQVPIRQGIAVTGSVNQRGAVQPIGGVNEKIEGFFAVCQAGGLTGDQGVMIPKQNVKNLGLKDDVAEAVENGLFHIWAVGTIEEGIEILTGHSAGEVFKRVEESLDSMVEKLRALEADGKEDSEKGSEGKDSH